ncbi:Centrosomal protein of 78 kDa [Entophlyctis sp. JEL0112]|nr:Centrosomal protein of 78 kDa [Entophlyctis sp. JEL0112]
MLVLSSIKDCLIRSSRITVLEIAGIYLNSKSLDILQRGLACNETLRELSLARSNIGDGGLFVLIPGIKAAKALCSINLAACQLSPKGAEFLNNLIKAVQRQAAHWAATLRAHPLDPLREGYPTFDIHQAMMNGPTLDIPVGTPSPIRRLNLCCNSLGDSGISAIMDGLTEEIGLLAVDLQFNDITDAGGRIVEQTVRANGELVIVDLRNNRLDPILLRIIKTLLQVNMTRRLKASDLGETKEPQTHRAPNPIEWLSAQHPLESTFHSTSTTVTRASAGTPYEAVRSAIRRANTLNHLRRHTTSSIKKQALALASKDVRQNELRRKHRKWQEVEEAAEMSIPRGHDIASHTVNVPRRTDKKNSTKAALIHPVITKIPSARWIEPEAGESPNPKTRQKFAKVQRGIRQADSPVSDHDMAEISSKLELLFPKNGTFNTKSEQTSTQSTKQSLANHRCREAQLWTENQTLKQQLFETQQQKLTIDVVKSRLGDSAIAVRDITADERNGLQGFTKPLPRYFQSSSRAAKNTASHDSLRHLFLADADDGEIAEMKQQSATNRSDKLRASIDRLAADLDAFIGAQTAGERSASKSSGAANSDVEFAEPEFGPFVEIGGENKKGLDDPGDAFTESVTDILTSYLGMSESALGVLVSNEDGTRKSASEILCAVDESLANFVALLEEIRGEEDKSGAVSWERPAPARSHQPQE